MGTFVVPLRGPPRAHSATQMQRPPPPSGGTDGARALAPAPVYHHESASMTTTVVSTPSRRPPTPSLPARGCPSTAALAQHVALLLHIACQIARRVRTRSSNWFQRCVDPIVPSWNAIGFRESVADRPL